MLGAQDMNNGKGSTRPIFVLSCERAGSTLLRYIVDTHPDVASPAELNLGELCDALYHSVYYSLAQVVASDEPERASRAAEKVRQIVSALMDEYTTAKGKSVWCEKTPRNLQSLRTLDTVFPDARYICLHRNCMDVVHSSLEVNWPSFMDQLAPYIRRNHENLTAAVVDSWIDKTGKLLAFERENQGKCFRMTYESLVIEPVASLDAMFDFLGLRFDPRLLDSVFLSWHDAGPGDDRIHFTKAISKRSLGKGSLVSRAKIPSDLLGQMNALLSELDYPPVGPDWDQAPSPYRTAEPVTDQSEAVATIEEIFGRRLPELLKSQREKAAEISAVCKIAVNGEGGGSWILNLAEPSIRKDRGEVEPDCVVTILAGDLIDIMSGRLNPMTAVDRGNLRIAGDMDLVTKIGFLLFGSAVAF
jgi:protein-tyrosine sulfotransferase